MVGRVMKDSGNDWIGKVPEDWALMRLKHIKSEDRYSIVDGPFGSAISTDDYVDEGVPLIRITNIKSPYISKNDMVHITEEHANTLQRSRLNKGDIVFAKTGATIGKCGINEAIDYGILSSSCVKISISSVHNIKYFYYLFYTDQFNRSLRDACVGTTRDTINLIPFSNLAVCVPSKDEQTRIANFLDKKVSEIDAVISKTRESIEEYKKLKQAIITEAVTKGIVPNVEMKDSGIEWIGEIPQGWNKSYFKYVSRIKDGLVDPRDQAYSEYPHIGPGNIEKYTGKLLRYNLVKDEGLISGKYIFDENDLVYGKINPQLGKVAYPRFKGLCSADAYAITADTQIMKTEYLFYFMLSKNFIDRTILESLRTGMPKINREDLNKIEVVVPTLQEQGRIVEYLEDKCLKYDNLISKKEQILSELERYKKSLIYEYVTGKKEVLA